MDEAKKRRLVEAGVDVDGALARLMQNEGLLTRLLRAFLQDTNFAQLQQALAARDGKAAFAAAHTLKGVAGNLSLRDLFARVSEVVECLRSGDLGAAAEKMPAVEAAYRAVVVAIGVEG